MSIKFIGIIKISKIVLFAVQIYTFSTSLDLKAQVNDLKVYIWDFSTIDNSLGSHTRYFTEEFEAALSQLGCMIILERRNFDRLIAHKDNEKEIKKLDLLSETTLDSLKSYHANAIIFGEIFDDSLSGEIIIVVSLQNFNGKISKWITRFSRGKLFDAESREKTMSKLAAKICSINPQTQIDSTKFENTNEDNFNLCITPTLNIFSLNEFGLSFIIHYFPTNFENFSIGVQAGGQSQEFSSIYNTLPGIEQTTKNSAEVSAYFGGMIRYYFSADHYQRKSSYIDIKLGVPLYFQSSLGLTLASIGTFQFGIETNYRYFKSKELTDLVFNIYGNSVEQSNNKFSSMFSIGISIGLNFNLD